MSGCVCDWTILFANAERIFNEKTCDTEPHWCLIDSSPVMDILQSRYYRINVRMLKLIGHWPYQESKYQTIHKSLFLVCVISVMVVQGIRLVEIWGDLDEMIECMTPMGVQLIATIKAINCIVKRPKMVKFFELIKRDWSNLQQEDEIRILTTYAQEGRRLTLTYLIYLTAALIAYLSIPLIPRLLDHVLPLNESRGPSYLYRTQYFVDPEEYFLPILLHTYTGTVITVSTVIASDSTFACYVHHVCGMLEIIGYRLENLLKTHGTDSDPTKSDDQCYRELVRCTDQHFKATNFVSQIEDAYSLAYLMQVGVSMVLLSLSAVQLLIKLGDVEEIVRLVQFNVAQFLHLFFNTWPGQKVLDQSDRFRDSVYFTEWYSLSMRAKVLLKIIMLRAAEPMRITAGKLYILSMENFGTVIRTSVSYFTVFASMR